MLLSDKIAVGVSRHHAMNYPLVPFTELTCFNEYPPIYTYFISMFVHENYQRREDIFQLTQRAFESGLFIKWHREIQLKPKPIADYQWEPFQIEHMGAAVLASISVLGFAVGFFILEIISFRKIHERNPSRFWIIIEMIINNKRYFLNASVKDTYNPSLIAKK